EVNRLELRALGLPARAVDVARAAAAAVAQGARHADHLPRGRAALGPLPRAGPEPRGAVHRSPLRAAVQLEDERGHPVPGGDLRVPVAAGRLVPGLPARAAAGAVAVRALTGGGDADLAARLRVGAARLHLLRVLSFH